ncbi:MAG: hypothetical protein E6G56_02970 [Actinobacteria bacterium]|nr:MAG: hypothetical protein E6G56_02970 [Actinomycetota bacterium]
MSEHILLLPEGQSGGRRHAHSACVARARRGGRLPTRDEWRRAQPRPPGLWTRLRSRWRA